MKIIISCFTVSLLLLAGCTIEKEKSEQTRTAEDQTRSTILENNYAEVTRVVLEPGDEQEAHEGKDRLIYSLRDYSIEWMEGGEDLGTKDWKKGMVHYHESGLHAAKNNSDTSAEWLVFARKDAMLPECGENTLEKDVSSVSGEYTEVLFENDRFKVTRLLLPAGEEVPMHSGINRVIYSLSDYTVEYETESEGVTEKSFQAGDTHWHEACMHRMKNLGQTDAELLIVAYK